MSVIRERRSSLVGIRLTMAAALMCWSLGATGCAGNGGAQGASPAANLNVAPVRVKTVRPQKGAALTSSVEQPADVASYYRVDLLAQTAGTVRFIEKTMGDSVKAGERLAELEPLDRSLAKTEKAMLRAPFDGEVSARAVDVGAFISSAAIVPGAPALISLTRTDIVTVSMKVPESFTAWVTPDTEAELRFDAFPGRALKCRLSRISPSMSAIDRTLLVEVDLYNGTADQYKAFSAREKATGNADLKSRKLPVFPEGLDAGGAARIRPGMFGRMKLSFKGVGGAALIPSSAIVRQGGLSYVYRVEGGKASRVLVQVNTDDGVNARVLVPENGGASTRELSESDEIVVSNQGELEDGSPVTAAPSP